MWPAVNHPTLIGLAATGNPQHSALAWEEFVRNSMHWQARSFPEQWVGLWTSSDTADADGMPGAYQPPYLPLLRYLPPCCAGTDAMHCTGSCLR